MAVVAPPPVPTSLVRSTFPLRPGFGTIGTNITVAANHFSVTLKNDKEVYHYDIAISTAGQKPKNEGFSRALCQRVIDIGLVQFKKEFSGIEVVSDGRKNLYSPKRLPFDEKVFQNILLPEDLNKKPNKNGKKPGFDMQIKISDPNSVKLVQLSELFQGKLNYTPYDAIQALDVALRYTASTRMVTVGRNFFSNRGASYLGEGADVWFGYHQSLRPTQTKLTLNIDVAATAFVKAMPMTKYIAELLNVAPGTLKSFNTNQFKIVSSGVRGIKVRVNHRGDIKRAYRVNGLSKIGADKLFFELEDKTKSSVASYFEKNYRRLQYPTLPCLHVGSVTGNNYLPIEVCNIMDGQKVPRKITDKQVANMIRLTCTKPEDRKRQIEEKFRLAGFDQDPKLAAFGLSVNPKMMTVNARILPQTEVLYAKNRIEKPYNGAWNMKGKGFFVPATLESMAIINFADPRRCPEAEIKKFWTAMIRHMDCVGMRGPSSCPIIMPRSRNEPISTTYSQAVQAARQHFRKNPQMILCIKSNQDTTYNDIKVASDIEQGVVSQCMLAKHIQKCNPQYISNLCMKLNVKLGGKNVIVSGKLPCFSDAPSIIFGADVTHPSPMDTSRPSIAAVVASMDPYGVAHAAAIRKQGHRVEQIEDLKSMAMELLKIFYQSTKRKPDRIIFYRDGVSEGQFQMVLNYEIKALRDACHSLEKGYNPRITFIVVQKRHHTRIFPLNSQHADKSGNVLPGTIVEKGICHPTEFDFYLMSHSGIQGTSRPTHYHVLLDENRFTPDSLQRLTFNLCYTFARCTRSVSIIPAVYYAHLVAFRARFFLGDPSDTGSVASVGDITTVTMKNVHANLSRSMYYV